MTGSVLSRVWKRNWRWISAYGVLTLGSIGASYFTSKWFSVVLSLFVAVASYFVGRRMEHEVIKEGPLPPPPGPLAG